MISGWASCNNSKIIRDTPIFSVALFSLCLRKWPKNHNFNSFLSLQKNFGGYFQWNAWLWKLCKEVQLSLKVAIRVSFRYKKRKWKFRFLRYFSTARKDKCDEKNWIFHDKFRMLMLDSNTYFLEVCAQVSLKLATKEIWKFSIS